MILALDQGTTSSRAILFDDAAQPLATAQQEIEQIFPQGPDQNGWLEHNPLEIYASTLATAHRALASAHITPSQVHAIGITNQRETTILWNRSTGLPIANAIVWQDRRTAAHCDTLRKNGLAPRIQQLTGLVLDAYFSATKIAWLLDHIPHARSLANSGQLAFGTVDSWLLYNLTGGKNGGIHATDPSNASRTMLMNLHSLQWDEELLQLLNIPRQILPAIRPSAHLFGTTSALGHPIPIAAIAGDQQSALFGQTCFSPGLAKNTYGTGCFLLMNTGHQPRPTQHQLLTTVAWQLPNPPTVPNPNPNLNRRPKGQDLSSPSSPSDPSPLTPDPSVSYALEGSVFVGGAVVQWLRDGLGIIQSADQIESLAASVPDSAGVYLVPAFAGLGAPHWDQYARGTITGLTRATTKGHIARAALEGIAFQVADVVDVLQKDSGMEMQELRVDGGASRNNLLMQFQADLLGIPVVRPAITETTALGAAYLAALTIGTYQSLTQIAATWKSEKTFHPQMKDPERTHRKSRWKEALNRARDWEQGEQK